MAAMNSKKVSSVLSFALAAFSAMWLALPVDAAEDVDAARDAADYHMMFVVEHIVPPFRLPDDKLLTCTLEGQPVTIFRGDAELRSGRPANLDVLCWPSSERQPESDGPNRIYYEDPNSPRTLIVWVNRVRDRLVAFDWASLD